MEKSQIKKWLDEVSQNESEKIKKELEGLTIEELQQTRAKAKEAFNNYSPSASNHDQITAFEKYERYLTDIREINKAINDKTKITVELLTDFAKTAIANALDLLDYLSNNDTNQSQEEQHDTERVARYLFNILQQLKELTE